MAAGRETQLPACNSVHRAWIREDDFSRIPDHETGRITLNLGQIQGVIAMRLTLRTLLAYMDDILEPSQAKEIGLKISESAYASDLTKRIREVMRRRRISAPDLDGSGQGIDANVVSEYLDNVLSPEAVTEIEKICLDSDVQLAEAAACHQILTLVMGDPIEVSEATRHRMYALGPASVEAAAPAVGKVEVAPAEPVSAPVASPAASGDFHSTVPDYLKRKPIWQRFAPFLLATSVIAIWLALVLSDQTILPSADEGEEVAAVDGDASVPEPGDNQPAPTPEDTTPGPVPTPNQNEGIDPEPPADEPGTGLTSIPGSGTSAKPTAGSGDSIPTTQPGGGQPAAGQPTTGDNTTEPVTPAVPSVATTGTDATNTPTTPDAGSASGTGEEPATPAVASELAAPPLVNETEQDVVLSMDVDSGEWAPVARDTRLETGKTVAVPEPFRATLRIEGVECQIHLPGGSRVKYFGGTDAGAAGFDIGTGHLILAGVGLPIKKPGTDEAFAFGLRMGGKLFRVELLSDDAVCGFEVIPRQPTEPLEDLGNIRCEASVFVSSGAVRVSDGQRVVSVKSGQSFPLISLKLTPESAPDSDAAASVQQPTDVALMPNWMQLGAPPSTVISSRYRNQFKAAFVANEPVEANIAPLIRDPDARLAEMAVNCLALIEDLTYMVSALQQSDHQECRIAVINGIRDWLPTAPGNDDILQEELNRYFPDSEASMIHRMLQGYSSADANNQFTALNLVDALAHEHIAIRELGFYYIRQLSTRKFDYQPNASARERAASIKRLREQVSREQKLPGAIQ